MRVTKLANNPKVYSCNVYYVRGEWNTLDDVNTLIDTGTDNFTLSEVNKITSYGVGKRKVEQIILTHEHFDHTGGLKFIKPEYNPVVLAAARIPGVDIMVKDEMQIKIGDRKCTIFMTPGHSNDSICIYCEEQGILFSGDTQLFITNNDATLSYEYAEAIKRLSKLKINVIYSGHDDPFTRNIDQFFQESLRNIKNSRII